MLLCSSNEIAEWMVDNKVLLCGYDVKLEKDAIKQGIRDGKCAKEVWNR